MSRWWKPNRILMVGLPTAAAGGTATGLVASAQWGVSSGAEWGFGVTILGIVWVVVFAYWIGRKPTSSGEASVLSGGDLNPLHPREGDRTDVSVSTVQTPNKCCWCGFEWAEDAPSECPNCHTPSPRWRAEFDINKTIGFVNEYAIQGFSTLDGRTYIHLVWPLNRGNQANLALEEYLLRQIRDQAQAIGLGLQDLTRERYTISFYRNDDGAVRIREMRPNPYLGQT